MIVISTIAKQALLLNILIWVMAGVLALLALTVILIPFVILGGLALFLIAIALPVVGAVKASDGTYYRYPLVGLLPS